METDSGTTQGTRDSTLKVPFLSADDIEERSRAVLSGFVQSTDERLAAPIDIERIIDEVLDLPILWEPIPPQGPTQIVSKLTQPTLEEPARIVINESLRDTMFREFLGLERTALGHEAGHAVFHLDRSRSLQLTLGIDLAADFLSPAETFTSHLDRFLKETGPHGDDWWREWQAHTFMRFILMPPPLLLPMLEVINFRSWQGLYELRDQLGVTISALVVHLNKLGIIEVDNRKRIHDISPRMRGQSVLDL